MFIFFTPEPTSLAGRASRSPSARAGPIWSLYTVQVACWRKELCALRCWECDIASNKGTFTPFPHYWPTWGSPDLAEEWVHSAAGHRVRGRTLLRVQCRPFSPFPLVFTISLPRSCGLPYLVQSWRAGE